LAVPIGAVTTRKGKGTLSDTGKAKTGKGTTAQDSAHECVFIYENGKCKMARVTTGIQDADYIEIKNGIKAGDEIISGPFTAVSTALYDGSIVKKVDKSELFTASGPGAQ
jgi:HlyD family secretion protein